MNKETTINEPQSLANAEALLAATAKAYNETGETQFETLVQIGKQLTELKVIYKKTPKDLRPEPTWDEYAEAAAKRCLLRFKSARMADLYIALYKDIEEVGVEAIKANVTDGSYREARSVANELGAKPEADPTVNPAIAHLRRSLKGLQNAEPSLTPELLLEIDPVKATLQAIIDKVTGQVKPAAQTKIQAAPAAMPQMPTEWKKRLEDAKALNDKAAFNAATNELFEVLKRGDVEGFPCEVTFVGSGKDLAAQFRRHEAIKSYIHNVTKALGTVRSVPSEGVASSSKVEGSPAKSPTPSNPPSNKPNALTASPKEFKPATVAEIAEHLGGKTALGKAVGKGATNADYWVKIDKLPHKHRAQLVKAYNMKGLKLDLSLIAETGNTGKAA